MADLWTTAVQLAFDCDPTWTDPQPTDNVPTPEDLRRAETDDLLRQGSSHVRLYRATTIHAPEYL